ncbi:MAG TPA: GDSL-type esterase/lipase family protein [Trichocoleus sp.]
MADVCWMAAQLLASCVNEAMSQTPALALEAAANVFAQGSLGTPMPPIAPSAQPVAPELPVPVCQVAQGRPSKMLDAVETLEVNHSRDQPGQMAEPSNSLNAARIIATQSQSAIAPPPRPPLAAQQIMRPNAQPSTAMPQFSRAVAAMRPSPTANGFWVTVRPRTGSQLYVQRRAALRAGKLYTRISPNEFADQWQMATERPTYQQWQDLLAQEAQSIAMGQGNNQLAIIVGDSLSLWLPPEWLSRDRFWLNQSISGETSAQILRRLPNFAATRPNTIHVMAGVNDLKQGASDEAVVNNLRLIMQQLRQQHPQARIVMYSILPTRLPRISSDRIRRVNQQVAVIAAQQGVDYLDLQSEFVDAQGNLDRALTTDGVHLNPQGYQLWHSAMLGI